MSPKQPIIVRRALAIGDALAATVVADKLCDLGHPVYYQTHPFIHPLIRLHPRIEKVLKPNGFCHVTLDNAYEQHPERNARHMSEFFIHAANEQLRGHGINLGPAFNCRPRISINPERRQATIRQLSEQHPKPWIYICPRSQYYNVRSVPESIWSAAAAKMKGTAFWLGMETAPGGIVDLHCRDLLSVITWLSAADLLVTVDTGPMHIAAALGVPVLAIGQASSPELHLSDQCDFLKISPKLDCLNCQRTACPINKDKPPCQEVDPELISSWTNNRLHATETEDVSAVIPIFRPTAQMLNRCLQAVLPQVCEVVITKERTGTVPDGMISDPKIRIVSKRADRIGFGRNVNFGVRHSRGKYVLVLNDDVYLAPDAVAQLMAVMGPAVGAVGQLLRYPDGTIYHAGKPRRPDGGIGFPHIDLRKMAPSISSPLEMENTNGASILFRRRAFYDADGYDEAFMFYAEDDDICMKLRKAGWSVWYTPFATGIHDEHRETRQVHGINQIMQESNRRFAEKWGAYFRHNANNAGLGNFDYLKGDS